MITNGTVLYASAMFHYVHILYHAWLVDIMHVHSSIMHSHGFFALSVSLECYCYLICFMLFYLCISIKTLLCIESIVVII